MNTQDRRAIPLRQSQRRRKRVLDVDLNAAPPGDTRDQEGTSSGHVGSQDGRQSSTPAVPAPIDLEAVDDDILISSPRAFAEAKNNARRTRARPIVVDVDSEERSSRIASSNRNKRRRLPANPPVINCDFYINLEGSNSKRDSRQSVAPQPPPPPKEPAFSCPVCMGPLVEEMSTKCGHIFCKACIKASIAAQGKCPTCRRRISMKDTIRVYLPATN